MLDLLNELTAQEKTLFKAVYAGKESRRAIAQALGKKQLNPADKRRLKHLSAAGLLEREQRPMPGAAADAWVYRVPESLQQMIASVRRRSSA
jgi:predicted transcriptional regulator